MSRDRVFDALEHLSQMTGLSLDPQLWSAEERRLYLELLQGPSNAAAWKNDLREVEAHRQRWNAFLNDAVSMQHPFKLSHAELVRRARRSPPIDVKPIVTGFTDWIFGLYESKGDVRKLEQHRQLESKVVASRIPVPEHSRWKLHYDGTSGSMREPLSMPGLLVDGQALRGKPDLVFREKKKRNRVVIVEIKISNASVPSDGWPSLRAQLWAYSKAYEDASEILLVGEIWAKEARLRRRRTLVWNASDSTLDRECSELFDIYRIQATGLNSAQARSGVRRHQ
jgi:hypothetical protein